MFEAESAAGARHLYLLDFATDNLSELETTITQRYPDVKVTAIQADASDEEAVQDVCERALQEEGRLDVFFANVSSTWYEIALRV